LSLKKLKTFNYWKDCTPPHTFPLPWPLRIDRREERTKKRTTREYDEDDIYVCAYVGMHQTQTVWVWSIEFRFGFGLGLGMQQFKSEPIPILGIVGIGLVCGYQ
jgi:hypothetical protein